MSGDKGDELSSIADDLTRRIIEAIIKVHQTLGPGFVEGIYHRALIVELKRRALRIDSEADVQIYYEDELVGRHRLDLVVEGRVIVELKVVEGLSRAHLRPGPFLPEGYAPSGRASREFLR